MFPFANVSHAIKLVSQKPILILWTIGLCLTCSVIANTVFTYGIFKIEAGTASILAASEPLTATLVGIFVFNDSTNTLKIIGIILILIAIIIQSDYFKTKRN